MAWQGQQVQNSPTSINQPDNLHLIFLPFLQQLEGHGILPCPGDLRCLPSSGIGGGVRVEVVSGWSGVWWAIDDERTANNTRKPRR